MGHEPTNHATDAPPTIDMPCTSGRCGDKACTCGRWALPNGYVIILDYADLIEGKGYIFNVFAFVPHLFNTGKFRDARNLDYEQAKQFIAEIANLPSEGVTDAPPTIDHTCMGGSWKLPNGWLVSADYIDRIEGHGYLFDAWAHFAGPNERIEQREASNLDYTQVNEFIAEVYKLPSHTQSKRKPLLNRCIDGLIREGVIPAHQNGGQK